MDAAGDVITYSIVVTNTGNQSITNVLVSDPLLVAPNGTLGAPVESGTADGATYIAMEYVDGTTLQEILKDRGPLELNEAREIATQFLAGLEAIHEAGLVHRDIKPEHILLNRGAYGELDLHILDFGVCAADTAPPDERGRERGRVYGTPSYASPEQASGNPFVDARAMAAARFSRISRKPHLVKMRSPVAMGRWVFLARSASTSTF